MVNRNELDDVPLQFLDHATFEELCIRLNKKQSPKIIIVDSLQYARFTYEQYKELKRQFVFGKVAKRRKIFIFISHANGKHPKGSAAVDIRYDANIKIWVEGFLADIESRYGSKKNYVIWEQRAKLYWGKKFNKMVYKLGKPKTPVVQDESKSITEEAK